MENRFRTAVVLTLMLLVPMSGLAIADGSEPKEPERSCSIFVDWSVDGSYELDNETGNYDYFYSISHRYRVAFEPAFINGSSPSAVNVIVWHDRADTTIGSTPTSEIIIAGGEIDVILADEPQFADEVEIHVSTTEATCSRELRITNWNQPIADHEITRTTEWRTDSSQFTEGDDPTINALIEFDGRGWQQRVGQTLISNELGNGSLHFSVDGELNLNLDLDRIWLNETYVDSELSAQDFEMRGTGNLSLQEDDQASYSVEVDVTHAVFNRSLSNGVLSEHLILNANGTIEFLANEENDSMSGSGIIPVFYYEYKDVDGDRDLQHMELEAQMTMQVGSEGGSFDFELDEFRMKDKWVFGVQEERLLKFVGSGEFGFIASESQPYIVVNGTIAKLHFEDRNGLVEVDTFRLDGDYSGDASGSFGVVREIVDDTTEQNSSGVYYEVNKIYEESWFNVSATPIGPIGQEISAEHNLTYIYEVPQVDWHNRVIRYEYVEENGTENEYPEDSPIIVEAEPPEAAQVDANPITRETGAAPEIMIPGDSFHLIGNEDLMMEVSAISVGTEMADGHEVDVINWVGDYGSGVNASGSIINEGLLAGLLNHVERAVNIEGENMSSIEFIENQTLERIHSPSIITADENNEPVLLELRFREGVLYCEGGQAHLEVVVEDVDTDMASVEVDLSEYGIGIVELSDRGLNGDLVIHDDIWTALIISDDLSFGQKSVNVELTDFWTTVTTETIISIENPAPRVTGIEFDEIEVYRGDTVSISVYAQDAHGIESVQVDLLSAGGESVQLTEGNAAWLGQFTVPAGMSPGERAIPIRLIDSEGATRLTQSILIDGELLDAPKLNILNEAPSIENVSIFRDGKQRENIAVPDEGEPISQLLEVRMNDPDGLSSVQVKIGRLAPIGQSEKWLLLVDDGTGGDRVAGDGIHTLTIDARSSLPEGDTSILIRGTDAYQSMTPSDSQEYVLTLEKVGAEDASGFWTARMTSLLIWGGLILLTILATTGIILTLRNSEFE